MGVIALMKCEGIDTHERSWKGNLVVGGVVKLHAMYTNDETMREYADATPSGKLELNIDNPDALKQFTPGKYYKILIEETKVD